MAQGIQVRGLSGVSYNPVKIQATESINPALFREDQVSPMATGIAQGMQIGNTIGGSILKAVEYNLPEAKAQRELDQKKRALAALQIGQEEELLPLEGQARKGALQSKIELDPLLTKSQKAKALFDIAQSQEDLSSLTSEEGKANKEQERLNKTAELKLKQDDLAVKTEGLKVEKSRIERLAASDPVQAALDKSKLELETKKLAQEAAQFEEDKRLNEQNAAAAAPGGPITAVTPGEKPTPAQIEAQQNADLTAARALKIRTRERGKDTLTTEQALKLVRARRGGADEELSSEQQKSLNQISDDYQANPFIKSMHLAQKQQGVLTTALKQKNGLGDLGAINAFQHMIDEGAVVRDQDVVLIRQAIPILQKYNTTHWINKMKNGEILPKEARETMQNLADKIAESNVANANEKAIPMFKKRAAASGIPHDLFIEDFKPASSGIQLGARIIDPATKQTLYYNGSTYVDRTSFNEFLNKRAK